MAGEAAGVRDLMLDTDDGRVIDMAESLRASVESQAINVADSGTQSDRIGRRVDAHFC